MRKRIECLWRAHVRVNRTHRDEGPLPSSYWRCCGSDAAARVRGLGCLLQRLCVARVSHGACKEHVENVVCKRHS